MDWDKLHRDREVEKYRGHPIWEQPLWKEMEAHTPPIADDELMTMGEVAELFCKRLKIGRSTFYRHYRKHVTVYYLAAGGERIIGRKIIEGEDGSKAIRFDTEPAGAVKRARRTDIEHLIRYVMTRPVMREIGKEGS